MKSILQLILHFPSTVNRLINGIDRKTAETIQRGFFFIMFILTIGAAIIGFRMGRDSASIQSPPLFDTTDQIFDIDINREKTDGDFSSLIDNEYIREKEEMEPERIAFPAKEKMEPETDEAIIEPEKTARRKRTPAIQVEEPVIEGEYKTRHFKKGDVKEIRKDVRTIDTAPEIISDDKAAKEPNEEAIMIPGMKAQEEGKTIRRVKRKEPGPIQEDTGIIGK